MRVSGFTIYRASRHGNIRLRAAIIQRAACQPANQQAYYSVGACDSDFFAATFFTVRFVDALRGAFAVVFEPVFLLARLAAAFFAAQRFRSAAAIRCRPSSEMFDFFFGGLPGPRFPGGRPGPLRGAGSAVANPRSAASALSIAALFCSRS